MTQKLVSLLADFATLFSYTWYKDYPIAPIHREWGKRADWTIHLGVTFRRVSDLMGYFGHFESGGRTDLVIRDNTKFPIAFCEWEWDCPYHEKFNEIDKLIRACKKENPKFCALFTYSEIDKVDKVLMDLSERWESSTPLLLILMHFQTIKGGRLFKEICYYQMCSGSYHCFRKQEPSPWNKDGSRWQTKGNSKK